VFQNVPLKVIMAYNLILMVKVSEKRASSINSIKKEFLNKESEESIVKKLKGFALIPLTKLFWQGLIRVGLGHEEQQL